MVFHRENQFLITFHSKLLFFMKKYKKNQFSGPVTVFHEKRLPETATPVGYAALIDTYGLRVPWPRRLSAIGAKHKIIEEKEWKIFTPRHAPHPTLEGHLTFALKHEGLDLAALKSLFQFLLAKEFEKLVKDKPTSSYTRRIWFLYEWLLGKKLSIPDADKGSYVPAVNPGQQWAVEGHRSPRHRVKNNLPGTPEFCPLVYRTELLEQFVKMNLPERAKDIVADVPGDLLARTAAFLLLKDSKSSYAIEKERAPHTRIQRWGRAIGEAGRRSLDLQELLRLQEMVIGDSRFVKLGLREEGGFVGQHDRETRMPLPEHISARPEDLSSLINGMLAFDHNSAQKLDPVIAASILAFGFIYVHPFEDGNGRIHRYLIHHVLAERGFNPPGIVFPVSAAILEKIDEYRHVLESYSKRLLPLIEWEPTNQGNIKVTNDTGDFYRFFDATLHAEFLFTCVKKTIEEDLPQETDFLRRYDRFREQLQTLVDMPDKTSDLLFNFLHQNNGKLSKRVRDKEFSELTDDEVMAIEEFYNAAFQTI